MPLEPVDDPLDPVDAPVGPAEREHHVRLARVPDHLHGPAELAQRREHDLGLVGRAPEVALALEQEERRLVPLLVSLGLVTLMSGSLGFSLGLIKSFGAMGEVVPESRWIWMLGASEALNNVALALILALVGGLAASVGALRIARSGPEPQVS